MASFAVNEAETYDSLTGEISGSAIVDFVSCVVLEYYFENY